MEPLSRETLEQILAYALTLTEPKRGRETPDQSDQRRGRAAKTIAEHLERAGIVTLRRPPTQGHKTPS